MCGHAATGCHVAGALSLRNEIGSALTSLMLEILPDLPFFPLQMKRCKSQYKANLEEQCVKQTVGQWVFTFQLFYECLYGGQGNEVIGV